MEGHLDGVNVGPLPMIEVGLMINFWAIKNSIHMLTFLFCCFFCCLQDSARGTMEIILGEESGTKEEIYANLLKQQVEIVLTAHPTEGKQNQRFEFCQNT